MKTKKNDTATATKKAATKKAGFSADLKAKYKAKSVEGPVAQALLKKINRATKEKPVMKRKLSDTEGEMARRLFAHGLVSRGVFEGYHGYYAKQKGASA